VRLSAETADHLPAAVVRPQYERATQRAGIVHFGIGAFHRAHQAVYTEDAMNAGDRNWGIIGVSLRSASVAEQMNPQDGLFTVTQRSIDGDAVRLVGAVQKVLVASQTPDAVIDALASPDTHIVSFTITEKGYCRAADGGLDFALADDASAYAYLAAGFRKRQADGAAGLTLMSCDNLASNGEQLQRLVTEYLEQKAPDLLDWFNAKCTCPSTMVDRIVPATTDDDRQAIEDIIGLRDEAAIVTEPFNQWVIEDRFAGPRPSWDKVGAQLTNNVHAYETAKLRMLNGAHSALAYLGLGKGFDYVHQAIADPDLLATTNILMREEAATSFTPAAGQDLSAYADALIARFKNPALNHRLAQIAMDGSQKIPQRWLETLAYHQSNGRQCPAILTAIAAWLTHVRAGVRIEDDPMADEFAEIASETDPDSFIDALFTGSGYFSQHWQPTADDRAFLLKRVGGCS
jgi:fructuronate reductase